MTQSALADREAEMHTNCRNRMNDCIERELNGRTLSTHQRERAIDLGVAHWGIGVEPDDAAERAIREVIVFS